jgi:site-specific recombinase XerD
MLQTQIQTAREINLSEICQTFLDEELLASSPKTQRWYRCRLNLFIQHLGAERTLSSITKQDLLRWRKTLETRTQQKPPNLAVETFHGYVRAARRLFKWLYDERIMIDELWQALELPKIPERERKGIKNSNVEKLMDAMQSDPRDFAIIHFMESTGARRGGLASLTLDDLDLDAPEPFCRRATVHEKGERVRTVIMSPAALSAMRAWLQQRDSSTDYVFVDARPGHDNGLEPGAFNQIISRYKKELGLTGRCSPHQWRHRFCRSRLKEGMPLSMVSQLAGHKSVTVTATFYGNLLVDELHEAYDHYYKPPTP